MELIEYASGFHGDPTVVLGWLGVVERALRPSAVMVLGSIFDVVFDGATHSRRNFK